MSEREAIADNLHADMVTHVLVHRTNPNHSQAIATSKWGVHVEKVEINDVKLPYSLMRAMAAEAEAMREARAKERSLQLETNN